MQAAIILVMALVAANLPFLVERRLFVLPSPHGKKFAWRLLELVLLYFMVGLVAWLVERNLGAIQPQRWEFYAVTVLFVPGVRLSRLRLPLFLAAPLIPRRVARVGRYHAAMRKSAYFSLAALAASASSLL